MSVDHEASVKEGTSRMKSMAYRRHGGKGSVPRSVDIDKWEEAYARIFGKAQPVHEDRQADE